MRLDICKSAPRIRECANVSYSQRLICEWPKDIEIDSALQFIINGSGYGYHTEPYPVVAGVLNGSQSRGGFRISNTDWLRDKLENVVDLIIIRTSLLGSMREASR